MKFGCHGLVWTGTFDANGIELAVRQTAEAGFDLIEFPLMNLEEFSIPAAKLSVEAAGLAATASLGLTPALDVSSDDPKTVRAGTDHLKRAVDVTAAIGGSHLVGVLYSAMTKYTAPASERSIANSQRAVAEVAKHAQDQGISISLEIVNRYETNVANTARAGLKYLSGVESDDVTLHLDTYHMNIEESDLWQPVLDAQLSLGYVHIGESHRGYLGTGGVDFPSFFRALDRIDYDGPVVFESFSSAVVSEQLSNTLGIWRNLWTDSGDLGRSANRFMRDTAHAVHTIELH